MKPTSVAQIVSGRAATMNWSKADGRLGFDGVT